MTQRTLKRAIASLKRKPIIRKNNETKEGEIF